MRTSKLFACFALVVALAARAENWPQFRGPTGQGVSTEKNLPLEWSATKNVAWKADIPGEGWSSPVVWGDRVFVTTATAKGTSAHVICLDAASGKQLWDVEVFQQATPRKQPQNSYATPTPCVDGKFVYAFFGAGGAAAVSFDGKLAWTNTEGSFYSQHGLGSSPILYKDLFILPWDHSIKTGPEMRVGWQIPWDKSYVLALDKATGKERYRAHRGMTRIAHMTPNVVDVDHKLELISAAGDAIEAFDPDSGEKLWWVESGGEGTTPSPVFGEGMVFAASGFPTAEPGKNIYQAFRAFKLGGGAGDLTKRNLVWEHTKDVPTLASPLYHDSLVYTVSEKGTLTCLQAADGKVVYTQKLPGTYSCSPAVTADGRIYLMNNAAATTVIQAGREFKQLAQNEIEGAGRTQASMAVSGGRLFIRTDKEVYCVKGQ
jgi:outer membrane protein assembly factor BamB